MKYLILLVLIGGLMTGCGHRAKTENKFVYYDEDSVRVSRAKVRIVLDMNDGFVRPERDSIFWISWRRVTDSVRGNLTYSHEIPCDTAFGLKNWKPIVVVIMDGNDTERHYYGDTLRYTTCQKSNQ